MIKTQSNELTNLDVLRTIAVFFVVFDHVFKFMGYHKILWFDINKLGVLGVLFFFVHTALVLMFSLERHEGKHNDLKLFASFYIRRIFRIYPLSVSFILFTVLFRIPSDHIIPKAIVYTSPDFLQIVTNLFLIQNLTHQPNIIGQYWSLPLEVQMYFMLPFLFLMVTSSYRNRILLLFLVLLGAIVLTRVGFMNRSFEILSYMPNFLGGIIAFVMFKKIKQIFPAWSFLLFVIIMSLFYSLFPTTKCGWLVCVLLGIGIPFFYQFKNRLIISFCHQIAKFSYGIYISHLFCIWASFVALSFLPMNTCVFS